MKENNDRVPWWVILYLLVGYITMTWMCIEVWGINGLQFLGGVLVVQIAGAALIRFCHRFFFAT